jgi:hypothetical protein
VKHAFDRLASRVALGLLDWAAPRVDAAQRVWVDAMRAELDVIPGGAAQVGWALGGLWLVWLRRRQTGLARAEPLESRVPGGAAFRVTWALSWSAAAVVVGIVLVGLLRLPGADVWDDWLAVLFVLGGVGLPAGPLQARLVPRWVASPWAWMLTTAVGTGLGFLVGDIADALLGLLIKASAVEWWPTLAVVWILVSAPAGGYLTGVVIGLCQTAALDGPPLEAQPWAAWLRANGVAGAVWTTAFMLVYALPGASQPWLVAGLALSSALYGTFSGAALEHHLAPARLAQRQASARAAVPTGSSG